MVAMDFFTGLNFYDFKKSVLFKYAEKTDSERVTAGVRENLPNKSFIAKIKYALIYSPFPSIIIRLFRIQYKTPIAEVCYFFSQIARCKK